MSDINVTIQDSDTIAFTITMDGVAMASTATNIATSVTNFNNNLTSADSTVQLALDTLDNITKVTAIGASFTNNSTILSTYTKTAVLVPFACTITEWDILSVNSGTFVADVKKSTYANYPTLASIAGTDKPTVLGNAYKGTSTALTGWTTTIASGDVLRFDIEQAIQSGTVTVQLKVNKA